MDARICKKNFVFPSFALAFAMALFSLPARSQDSSQQSSGDAVADAARKAREQKKKDTEKPKKVYTDDDVSHSTYVGSPASGDANASTTAKDGAKDGSTKGADAAGAQGNDAADKGSEPEESPETKWRKQFKAVYANLDRAQKELDILQREDNKAQLQYYTDPQKALAEQYSRKDINEKDAKIAAKKKEIDQIKQQISDMEDALRKAGGDPGWAAP